MKKILALITGLVICFTGLMGCSVSDGSESSKDNVSVGKADDVKEDKDVYTIGVACKSLADPFTSLQARQFKEIAEKEYPEFKVEVLDCEFDSGKQINIVENFISQGVDLIVVQTTDDVTILPTIEKAKAAGIPVFSLLNDLTDDWSVSFGTSPYNQGKIIGEYAATKLPENAKLVYIQGELSNFYAQEREKGTKEALEAERPDVEWVSSKTANWMRDQAIALTEDWLESLDHIDGLFAADDNMCLGGILAIKARGRLDEIQCYGLNGDPEAVYSIENNEMLATVLMDGMAMDRKALECAKQLLVEGKELEEQSYIVEDELISEETGNVEKYKEIYKEAGTWYEGDE